MTTARVSVVAFPRLRRAEQIWHEMGTCLAISVVCIKDLLSDKPADIVPHAVAAVLFAGWYAYLSQQY